MNSVIETTTDSSAERLRSFVARIERLEEEKSAIAGDIKDCYAELRGMGFDGKIVRQVIKLRKMETADREEYEELLDLYKAAVGLLVGTPLGDAAMPRRPAA